MSNHAMHSDHSNPWKILSIAMFAGIASALLVGGVVASFRSDHPEPVKGNAPSHAAANQPPQVAANQPPPAPQVRRPSAQDIEECNSIAKDAGHSAEDTLKDAVIGGAVGAGIGAAGGAIANGGRGAGKGAGIGGIVGAAAGTLYGINQSNQSNGDTEVAYRQCMARKGF